MMRLGPPSVDCRVHIFREGLLARIGHDLELVATRFDIRVDEVARAVDASFDAASLRVVGVLRDGVATETGLSASDRRSIEDNVRRDVLEVGRHPEIRFRSVRVVDVPDGFHVVGRLVLHGKDREIVVPLRRRDDRYTGEVRLHQPDFGIRPYSAFLGALKVAPDVVVRLSLPATPSA